MRVSLYIRVSTDEQAEHGYSVPEQRRELLAHAEREGMEVVEVVVDEGYSGAVGVRPGLDRITKLAEAGEIDVVLAKKRNRLFRDRYIRIGYERSMREYGVRLVALDDAGHRFADAVMDEFSDWYREEVAKNTVAGRMEKARQGKLIATHTPIFGFDYTPDREGFVVVPESMAVVERVIRSVAVGESLHGVKRQLENSGVPAPAGGRLWGVKTVREIVTEDAYRPHAYKELAPLLSGEAVARLDPEGEYGIVWYPRRKVKTLEPDPERGYRRPQKTTQRAREEQVAIPVVSSGIPRDVVDAARERLRDNRPSRSNGHRVYELAGRIRCAECENLMGTNRKVSGSALPLLPLLALPA
jgi:site-specific DNA recombinase